MAGNSSVNLSIPRQNLHKFSLFQLNAEAAQSWAQGLPVANTRSVVQQLRHALSDLNHVKLTPEVRYDIMEALRPKLDVALSNLAMRFLNQPLVMPEEPRQMAEVADSLFNMTRTAYTIVALQAIELTDTMPDTIPASLAGEAIQRALVYAGRKILQSYQLYNPIEARGWQNLHQLYVLAEEQGLTDMPVKDPLTAGDTISATYMQALMLSCGKPNQMRQNDLAAYYRGLKDWSDCVKLEVAQSGKGLFMVELDSDQPPVYTWLYNEVPGASCRLIDTKPLIERLEQLKASVGGDGIVFDKDTIMPANILDHLITSLGSMSLRNFNRTSSNSTLSVCFGLSSSHYHISGERRFEQMLHGDDYVAPNPEGVTANPFLQPSYAVDEVQEADPHTDHARNPDGAEDPAIAHAEREVELHDKALAELAQDEDSQLPAEQRYPIYEVPLADASPGGYCLECTKEVSSEIKTGDIVSLKEAQNRDWMIAVIRWASHSEDAKTFIGLELLSPRAMPYGACIQQKTGADTAPMRVLLLPEIKLVGQPHTLITPRAGFKERQKITLINAGEEFYIQLLNQINITGSFAQFDFHYVKQLGDTLAEDKSWPAEAAYDSVWSHI